MGKTPNSNLANRSLMDLIDNAPKPTPGPVHYEFGTSKDSKDTTIEVLREHVNMLTDMLKSRDDFWRKEAEALRAENKKLASDNIKIRVYLAEATEYIIQLEHAANEDHGFMEKTADEVNMWSRAARQEG